MNSTRRACKAFLKYPSLENWMAIRRSCEDATVPCIAANHPYGAEGYGCCYCDKCPLGRWGFKLPHTQKREGVGGRLQCPLNWMMHPEDVEELYNMFQGELIIAMVQFVLGFEDEE